MCALKSIEFTGSRMPIGRSHHSSPGVSVKAKKGDTPLGLLCRLTGRTEGDALEKARVIGVADLNAPLEEGDRFELDYDPHPADPNEPQKWILRRVGEKDAPAVTEEKEDAGPPAAVSKKRMPTGAHPAVPRYAQLAAAVLDAATRFERHSDSLYRQAEADYDRIGGNLRRPESLRFAVQDVFVSTYRAHERVALLMKQIREIAEPGQDELAARTAPLRLRSLYHCLKRAVEEVEDHRRAIAAIERHPRYASLIAAAHAPAVPTTIAKAAPESPLQQGPEPAAADTISYTFEPMIVRSGVDEETEISEAASSPIPRWKEREISPYERIAFTDVLDDEGD